MHVGSDAARSEAHHELSKRIYHANDEPWLLRALDHIYRWFSDAFHRAADASPGGAVGLVVIVLALVAVIVAMRLGLGPLAPRARTGRPLFTEVTVDAATHRRAAELAETVGDFSEAVAERMRAIVRELEERGVLDIRAGRTADEAAAEAGPSLPAGPGSLRSAVRVFDDVRYGGRIATADDAAALRAVDDEVRRARFRMSEPVATT